MSALSPFSHLNNNGETVMVDVGDKNPSQRIAIARTTVVLSPVTMNLLEQKALPKGDALQCAKIAGIMAAKQTHALIPLCHQLALEYIDVRFTIDVAASAVVIETETRTTSRTGVEIEALTAAQIAALTIYDMCKAVQKDICITNCRLIHKSGGKTDYHAE